jgi:hypothetical protein
MCGSYGFKLAPIVVNSRDYVKGLKYIIPLQ